MTVFSLSLPFYFREHIPSILEGLLEIESDKSIIPHKYNKINLIFETFDLGSIAIGNPKLFLWQDFIAYRGEIKNNNGIP